MAGLAAFASDGSMQLTLQISTESEERGQCHQVPCGNCCECQRDDCGGAPTVLWSRMHAFQYLHVAA